MRIGIVYVHVCVCVFDSPFLGNVRVCVNVRLPLYTYACVLSISLGAQCDIVRLYKRSTHLNTCVSRVGPMTIPH